jgi:hypothetical protein
MSHNERGFSLVETVISLGVLTVGLLAAIAVLSSGLLMVSTAPGDLTATQKAVEAIESVVSSRDTRTLTWAQMRNVEGVSGDDGGVFIDGPQQIRVAGDDGIVATADDGDIETVTLPGRDAIAGTADDETVSLERFRREISIRDVGINLRSVTVTVTYRAGSAVRTYSLTTYISNYS